jgi:hypothetical protein
VAAARRHRFLVVSTFGRLRARSNSAMLHASVLFSIRQFFRQQARDEKGEAPDDSNGWGQAQRCQSRGKARG